MLYSSSHSVTGAEHTSCCDPTESKHQAVLLLPTFLTLHVTADPLGKGQGFSVRAYCDFLEAVTLCDACFPSCSRITNVSRVPNMTIHYKCIPARGMNATRDVLQSTDPSALIFLSKKFRKGKAKDCTKACEMQMF